MADISKILASNGTTYNIKDTTARSTFAQYRRLDDPNYDEIYVTELNSGNIINTGAARFLNTINGSISGNAATASDAAKLNGYASDTSATNNTIARRTANGYIFATYFNQSSGAETPTSSSYMIYANSDGYFRKSTVANMKTAMSLNNVENKSSATIRGEITSANVTTALGYTPVNKAGDTMSGTLNFTTSNGISYQGTKATYTMISFKDNANDNYGNGIVIGGGGLTVVGGGESATTVAAQYSSGGDEILELTSDGNVYVRTNVQSGYASAKTFTFSTDGSLTATKFIGSLQGNADTATKATQDSDGNAINTTYLKLSGGTMTGQIKTSFKSAIAMGSRLSDAATIDALVKDVRYSSGCMGSVSIGTAYTKNGVTIPTGWYNYEWIPHRSGGVNGAASGDNCDYGVLYLSHMTSPSQGTYEISFASSSIAQVRMMTSFTTAPTSAQVVITDDIYGGIKSSGYTIATSVPANAVFTDTKYALDVNGNNVRLKKDGTVQDTITVPYATSAGSATDSTKLPLAGGNMTGASGIQFPTTSGNNKTGNWISAGGGYSTGSGKSGVKIIACEQSDCISGLGQDLSGLGGYDFSLVAGANTNGNCFISFLKHTIAAATTYTRLGHFDGSGNFTAVGNSIGVVFGVSASNGTSGGISLYSGAGNVDNYGITFRKTTDKGKHGYVQSDWATYFTMNSGATTRGWVFKLNQTNGNLASISGAGNAVFNGSLTLGGNEANTSGVRQVYNSTTNSLDFVFVA